MLWPIIKRIAQIVWWTCFHCHHMKSMMCDMSRSPTCLQHGWIPQYFAASYWSEWTIWSFTVDRLLRQRYYCLTSEISIRMAPMMQAVFSSGHIDHQLKPTWSIHIMLTKARCMNLRLFTCGANHHCAQGATTSTKVPAQDCEKVLTATSRLDSIWATLRSVSIIYSSNLLALNLDVSSPVQRAYGGVQCHSHELQTPIQ